ncbi:MAG: hypothetical protein JWN83_1301 [Chitinophagaceae bacterium]|nr:hypothetical protein [Chitinophagaceae bacterium]
MQYADHKNSVLKFFDEYALKYLVSDLEMLDSIKADDNGIGGCAIPQAISTFSAVDLFGFLLDTQDVGSNITKMRLMPFLKNKDLFPTIDEVKKMEDFLNSFRDDIRSIMTHRFFLAKYDIAKLPETSLLIQNDDKRIFNVSYFTKLVVSAIREIYNKIKNDVFILPGDKKNEETIERFYNRLELLRSYESESYQIASAEVYPTLTETLTVQTTQSLNR